MPLTDYENHCHQFLFIRQHAKACKDNAWLAKDIGCPSYIKITPIPTLDASHLIINSFKKSNKTRVGVDVIACFKELNGTSASKVYWNWSFCRSIVRGWLIFP